MSVPTLVRDALRSFDSAAGTNFATPPGTKPAVCTAEALTASSLAGAGGALPVVLGGVHDAACRNDRAWLNQYLTPGAHLDGPPLPALAEAIEAGPGYTARGWTFQFATRFTGLRALRGATRGQ
ncbi:hypothetical protein [Paractinoplanes durhamensis]|uniref:Uncharacterized protein n=1 Tax=Paractinoplanes durhamensis TaxID=113563 RepID=A0ABQ3YV20_9ACTN|nr:hypothetical protein [Actinoplanes durhamensis]GIE01403.1 hypothetical protein Adu01nite_27530 [Actinoplanes durhamensis]